MDLENTLVIGDKEVSFTVNIEKIKKLELRTGKGIFKLMQDIGLVTVEAVFTQFVNVEKDKDKLFNEALNQYGMSGLFEFLTNQIQSQAGFLFR